MPALMEPEKLAIQGAGESSTASLGKYVQVKFSKELLPQQEVRISYEGVIRPAGSFDLAVQAKVLDSAFFLADSDILLTPRSAVCLGSASPACGDAENYLMSDQATGRIRVVVPEAFLVSSPGEGARSLMQDGRAEHIFEIATPQLATFMVAGAPFRESAAMSANGVKIRVLRSPKTVADGNLEAPLAEKILSFYESVWPAYPQRELTILETPTPFGEALALQGTVAISDKIIGSRSPISGSVSNLLEFVMAHEIAHQWWGFGVVPTRTPGRLFVIESIPQFAAYKFLGKRGILNEEVARRNEEKRYQAARRRLGNREVALARAENADEVAYNKGPLVLLSLDQSSGTDMMGRLGSLFQSYSHGAHGRISPDELVTNLIAELPEGNRETARAFFFKTGMGKSEPPPAAPAAFAASGGSGSPNDRTER
jgi:hypothetical protein